MRPRLFDHIDLRVRDLKEALPFYDVVLPALGFEVRSDLEDGTVCFDERETDSESRFVGLTEDPDHFPNATRFALLAESKEAVDVFGEVLAGAPARNVEGPMYNPEYGPGYYAIFFEDPCGNRWEFCCHTAPLDGDAS